MVGYEIFIFPGFILLLPFCLIHEPGTLVLTLSWVVQNVFLTLIHEQFWTWLACTVKPSSLEHFLQSLNASFYASVAVHKRPLFWLYTFLSHWLAATTFLSCSLLFEFACFAQLKHDFFRILWLQKDSYSLFLQTVFTCSNPIPCLFWKSILYWLICYFSHAFTSLSWGGKGCNCCFIGDNFVVRCTFWGLDWKKNAISIRNTIHVALVKLVQTGNRYGHELSLLLVLFLSSLWYTIVRGIVVIFQGKCMQGSRQL